MFRDRIDAGRQLAAALSRFRGRTDALVLGVPRGGVVVAAEVARALALPLDVLVTRKIGAPGNPEYAIAAVDADGVVLIGSAMRVSDQYLQQEARLERAEIERRTRAYRGDRAPAALPGTTVLLVDDGIATGLTLQAAVGYLKRHGAARVVVAAPVAAPPSADALRALADEVVTLAEPYGFAAVGQYYARFDQTSDAEVVRLLEA